MRNILFFSFLLYASHSLSQRHPIGSFFSHLPYQQSFQIALADSVVYCHAGPSIFSYSQETERVEELNKITGLSDMGIRSIGGDPYSGILFIGYESGNLDLLVNNEVINFRDIRRANIIADKAINHFLFTEGKTYISTGFGILVFDTEKLEFSETYLIGANESYVFVNACHIHNDTLFATSNEGLYFAPLAAELVDFRVWQKDASLDDFRLNHIFSFKDTLFINKPSPAFRNDTVYFRDPSAGSWHYFDKLSNETNYQIRSAENSLSLAQSNFSLVLDASWNQVTRVFDYGSDIPPAPRDALYDNNGTLWIADNGQGLIKSRGDFNNEILTPAGPKTRNNYKISTNSNQVFVASGGLGENWLNNFNPAEVYLLDDDSWMSFDRFLFDTLAGMNDLLDTETSDGERFYFASYGGGLIECSKNQLFRVFNASNSSLLAIPEDSSYVAVSGLYLDEEENLWVGNSRSSKPLHVKTSNDEWISFPIEGFSSQDFTGDLIQTSWGHIWLFLPKRGILVYDYNNTLEDFSDDRYRILTSAPNQGGLPSNELRALAEDQSGAVWVGTNLGLRVFFSAASVLDNNEINADEILIQQDGFTEILFENEHIAAIYVDQANRKWIGTKTSGAFLLSADGKEEIHRFNEDNSPLFSNSITSIAVLEASGEVFIGTERGIIAYKADATSASSNFDKLIVYPNPVPQNYEGLIAIKNTTNNAFVKITDVSGNLIYETRSNGGQAVWNGKNRSGDRVATGVYLVYCNDAQGNLRGKTKFLYLR